MARGKSLRMGKAAAFILETKGFDKMVEALSPEKRKPVLKEAMLRGGGIVQRTIRSVYKESKPGSNLGKGILLHLYPSAEGATVRRLYVPGGAGKRYAKGSPYYRSYILNFLNAGAKDRYTKGKGRYYGKTLSRGSIPALKFFQKGRNKARNKAFAEIERYLLVELAKQARR